MAQAERGLYSTSTIKTRQGVELYLHRWQAVPAFAAPLARIALIHGLAEHGQRYDAFALRLNAAGIELVAVDLRGHGRSSGERAWIRHFDEYLLDADALLEVCAATPPADVPLILMGHSMGGSIAALYAAERLPKSTRRLAGLILSSAALKPGNDVPRWMLAMSQVVSRVMPRFPALKIDPAALSRARGVVEANRRDPLVHHDAVPARTGAQLLDAMKRIAAGAKSITLPVLVFHGDADTLTEPAGSREFEANVGSTDATLMIHQGSYHETLNDLDRDRVIQAVIDWTVVRADLARSQGR
jgi:alpha-beta hydrolase superfamily lysophospholipase